MFINRQTMIRSNTVQLQKRVSFNALLLAVCFHYTSYGAKEKRKNNFLRGIFYFQNLIATISNATPATKPKPTFTCGVQNVELDKEEAPEVTIFCGTTKLALPAQTEPFVLKALGVYMTNRIGDAPALGFLGLTSPPKSSPSKVSPFLKWYFNGKFAIFDIGGTTLVPFASKSWLKVYFFISNIFGMVRDKVTKNFLTFYSFEKTDRALAKLFFLFSPSSYRQPCYEARHIANNVFALGAVAGFGAINCQPTTKAASRQNAELTTKTAIEPNACYMPPFFV